MFEDITGDWAVTEVDYESGSPATGGLYRVQGEGFSVFVKLLQHVRHWPRVNQLPERIREDFVASFRWKQELSAWEPAFAGCLPDGMRLPKLYGVTDLGDDRLLVWMEDVDMDASPWKVERFALAARLLGAFAANRSKPEILAGAGFEPGFAMRKYVEGRLTGFGLPMLGNDEVWSHPYLDPALRKDLQRLSAEIPSILDRLDALPQSMPHGDASPQNLLAPAGSSDELVAIDISFQCPHAAGFDLGQLLIGLVHAGAMPAAMLPAVHEVLVPSFAEGYGVSISTDDVAHGYLGSLLVRAAFTSLPYELLSAAPSAELEAMFRERVALTRFIIDTWDGYEEVAKHSRGDKPAAGRLR